MSKSQKPSTFIWNGNEYYFNRIGFIDAIKAATQKRDASGKRITQQVLRDKIADKVVLSPESVYKWQQGHNAPGDIKYVEICADVLETDISHLLTPIDSNKGVISLTDKEIELISIIYEECVSCIYLYYDAYKEFTDDGRMNQDILHQKEKEYFDRLSEAHRMIDARSLFITDGVKYRLHRIVNDMSERNLFLGMSERWEEINTVQLDEHSVCDKTASLWEMVDYSISPSRNSGISRQGLFYIEEEKALAEKLGYKYPDIPQEYYDDENVTNPVVDGSGRNIGEVCKIEDSSFELDANILFKDMMTRFIKMVFANDFPEIKFPE